MKNTAQPGDTVELKDKETGFYDQETDFQVVRDQQAQLGSSIGRRTNEALMSGGLLVVGGGKAKAPTGAGEGGGNANEPTTELPEDFPGRDAFAAAKMDLAAVKAFDFEKDKVAGVGAKTIEAVQEYLKK